MKSSGAVLIGRVNSSIIGSVAVVDERGVEFLRAYINSINSILTVEEVRSPVSNLRIRHIYLGALDAS